MTAQENKRLMQQVFGELAKGNIGALVEVLGDEVDWHVTGTTRFSKTYRGKAGLMKELVEPLFAQFLDQFTLTADRFIAEDNYVVVECHGKVTTRTGQPYNNKYCLVCRLEDGKIRELVEYMDTNLVVTTFGS